MNLHISKSKNAESFYICKSYVKANGSTSSMIVRKLGTLEQLLIEHGPTRDDVLAWAKNEVKIETEKYKKENEEKNYYFYVIYCQFLQYPPGSVLSGCTRNIFRFPVLCSHQWEVPGLKRLRSRK